MWGWFKRRREEKRKAGEEMGERLGRAAKAFIDGRAEQVAGGLMEALKTRLGTLSDHPEGISDSYVSFWSSPG
ncbi:MAG TPA: hypothetical protein VFE34_03265 [Dongiaceae bacterium]|jgi:hypothetical protein|nr:hypothetical protein [Dongiaceae bacterium]